MNNIKVGNNGVTALRNATFLQMGLNSTNTAIVYLFAGLTMKSWKPGRTINGIDGIVEGENYFIKSRVAQDLTSYVTPDTNMQFYSFESKGVLPGNTAAQNKAALQAAINSLDNSSEKIRVLYGSDIYNIAGPIDLKKDVFLLGNGVGLKGSAITATFRVTDNTANLIRMCSHSSIQGFNFDYPNNGATTTTSNVISYPATIVQQTGYQEQMVLKDLTFIGNSKSVVFNDSVGCADIHLENLYGYPLEGTMFEINNCFDIPYINLIHVNPGTGRGYRPLSPNGLPFSDAMIDYVVLNGAPTFRINTTDEFVVQRLFAFGVKTGLQVQDSYGSAIQCNFDMVNVAFDIAPHFLTGGQHAKAVQLIGCSCYPTAGTFADRAAVVYRGLASILDIQGLNIQLGTNPAVPSSSNPNLPVLIRVNGTGNQRLIMTNVTSDGTVTLSNDVIKSNSAASVKAFGTISNAVTKFVTGTFFEG